MENVKRKMENGKWKMGDEIEKVNSEQYGTLE